MGFLSRKQDEPEVKVPATIMPEEVGQLAPVPKVEEVEVKPEEKKEKKHRLIVVKEIPTQEVRETESEDGTILHFITVEEALTEAINK